MGIRMILGRTEEAGVLQPNDDHFNYGARSAIQKAIRRGMPDMARQAFEILWRNDPKWIIWRLQAIVPEEIWQLSALNIKICRAAQEGILKCVDETDSAKSLLLGWILKLTTYAKNRDANGLAILLENEWRRIYSPPNTEISSKRWRLASRAMEMKNAMESRRWFDEILKEAPENRKGFIDAASTRFFAGGMDGDKRMLMCMAIIATTEPEIVLPDKRQIDEPISCRTGDWPWYVYDMHTLLGKRAMAYAIKVLQWNRTAEDFKSVWFVMESGKCDRHDEATFWWREYLGLFMKRFGITRKDWDDKFKPVLRGTIERFLADSRKK